MESTLIITKLRFSCLPQQKPNLWDRGWWKRKSVYSNAGHPRRWGTLVPQPVLTSQCRLRCLEGGRGKGEQRDQKEEVNTAQLRGLCASQQSVQVTGGKSANLPKLERLKMGVCLPWIQLLGFSSKQAAYLQSHMSQSQHPQKQCRKNGGVGYNPHCYRITIIY